MLYLVRDSVSCRGSCWDFKWVADLVTMKQAAPSHLHTLRSSLNQFDPEAISVKISCLKSLSQVPLVPNPSLIEYHDFLLFLLAYPGSESLLKLVVQERKRMSTWLSHTNNGLNECFDYTGLPFSRMTTRFSPDMFRWLEQQKDLSLELDTYDSQGLDLQTLLSITLPDTLKEETTAGLENEELLMQLGVAPKKQLYFLLREFSKIEPTQLQDYLWQQLNVNVCIQSRKASYSRLYNRLDGVGYYFQEELLRKFDQEELWSRPLPQPQILDEAGSEKLVQVILRSMSLTMRETDPSTYMDPSSLRFYHLERGISIAIYGMQPCRQLPLQSYIGYTLFRNGYPVSYGGSWIFGGTANFGINIFETFRGGESGYIMCQLLRTYIQVFQLHYVEVESYQIGKGNEDGINSGAFWFYYRYGFRPIDPELAFLAASESKKIQLKKNYRSSRKRLLELVESNIALKLNAANAPTRSFVSGKIQKLVAKKFKGDNQRAIQTCIREFSTQIKLPVGLNQDESKVLEDVALWAAALKVRDPNKLKLLGQMIAAKPVDPYRYNELIRRLFE